MDNAVRLFLLASNLGSLTITSWCAEFLRPRVSRENVEQIWWVANATKSTHMMDICVPVIAAHFDTITTQVTFHSTTELDSLLSMLRDDRLVGVAGAAKLRTIVNWFEGKSTSNRDNVTAFVDDDDSRVATFKDLLGAVNISEITSDDFVEFCMSDCWINLQRQFRDLISNAWKEARRRGLVQDYLIAYTYSHSKVTLTTSNWKEIEKKIIARSAGGELPTADVNFRCTVPSRSDCAVVVLNDSIYLIGGRNERAGASRLVDRVDPFDGRVSSAPPMVQARYWFSAAATPAFNCQQLLVFGGYNGTTQMSSCEKFDPAVNRWTPLPDMLTPRSCCGAVSVPVVGVVVVGGYKFGSGNLCATELLSCSREDNVVRSWSWRQLAPMMKPRIYPGVAYFRDRVVVAGGDYGDINVFECFRLPAGDNDHGQWTQLHALEKGTSLARSPVVLNKRLLLADRDGKVHEFVPASDSKALTLEEFTWKPIFTIQNLLEAQLLVLRR
uniref:BACK domain-containing protein n=1 Tax=Mesocestoides corti TaxID=53468 RepID=A0A5K3FU54_MESCO